MLVDFHNHVLPAVDDGARDAGESRRALLSMYDAGVHLLIATPHVQGSAIADTAGIAEYQERIAQALEDVRRIAAMETPDLTVELGAEVLLDSAEISVSDPRVRLAGTRFVLVEFSLFGVPPNGSDILFRLRMQGWQPVLGHPERYGGLAMDVLEQWRTMGTLFQVNAGSLLGDYGPQPRDRAWELLREGMADYICGDYHARGKYRVPAALDAIEKRNGKRTRDVLVANGVRLSRDEMPQPVPPLAARRWFDVFTGRGRARR